MHVLISLQFFFQQVDCFFDSQKTPNTCSGNQACHIRTSVGWAGLANGTRSQLEMFSGRATRPKIPIEAPH